jgi:hypothetical protein
MPWTVQQVLALAPDAGSAKAGRDLASPRRWGLLGASERALWGECQGSGKHPYQVKIDLDEPAFACTCPSRKFPCKHGLGLMLLSIEAPEAVARALPPAWVAEWLEKRAGRTEKRQQKTEQTPDPTAQAKRVQQREAKITAGLVELELWLSDAVRGGLAALQGRSFADWETIAARMVDAQAPGLARQLRTMAGVVASGEQWPSRLLDRLARLYLLIEGYRRLDAQDPEVCADLRSAVGWTVSQDEVLRGAGVRDTWLVVGQRTREEDRLQVNRTWLWGSASERAALLVTFTPMGVPASAPAIPPGIALEAELVFFPGAWPLRALVRERFAQPDPLARLPGHGSIRAGLAAWGAALGRNPFIETFPLGLAGVVPVFAGGRLHLRDREGSGLPVAPGFAASWQTVALSGGRPFDLFGEWDGESFLPLSAFAEGRFVVLEKSA